MAIGFGVACPKPKTRKQEKAKRDREDAKALKAWRDAAWLREPGGGDEVAQWGVCFDCRCYVFKRKIHPIGQVHHIVSRRHKQTRHDVSNAVILCRGCHNKRHGREF